MRTSILSNPPLTLNEAQALAADLARNMHLPAHVVIGINGEYLVCDDDDMLAWQLDQVVYTVEPEAVYPLDPPSDDDLAALAWTRFGAALARTRQTLEAMRAQQHGRRLVAFGQR